MVGAVSAVSSKAERSLRQCQSSAVRVFGANRTPQALPVVPLVGHGAMAISVGTDMENSWEHHLI